QLRDVSATCDPASRALCLAVVNRSPEEALATTIQLNGHSIGAVTVDEVNAPDLYTRNSFGAPNVNVQTRNLAPGGEVLEYTFPAHSVTVLRAQYQRRQ